MKPFMKLPPNIASRLSISLLGFAAMVVCVSSLAQRVNNDTLRLPTTLPAGEYDIETAWSFSSALTINTPPGETNQLFIGERSGRIRVISDVAQSTIEFESFLDISSRVTTNFENGMLGVAFHPEYANNRQFYVFYTTNASGTATNRLSRFLRSESNEFQADPDSELILFDQIDQAGNHNGGDIHFGPDGYLYVAVGDEGGANDNYQNGQFVDKDLFAGLLRLDVDKRQGNLEPTSHNAIPTYQGGLAAFSIPADNPLVERWQNEGSNPDSNLRLEFYAIGLRNPWRFSFDPATGDLWLSDVGQGSWEEVDIIVKGGNYGWPVREGLHSFPRSRDLPNGFGDYLDPIHEYSHSVGASITGGVIYRGSNLPELYGAYIFGDYVSGRVWALFRGGPGEGPEVTQITSVSNHFAYGVDPSDGDVLIATSDSIRRLVRGDQSPAPDFPATLSATGAFSNLATLEPEAGLYPYTPNVAFWSDHAIKSRWVSIPGSDQVGYSQDDPWNLPQGSLFVKHFDLELERGNPSSRRRIETRFIVKTDRGAYGLSYQWNEAQTDATLVSEDGVNIDFDINVNGESVQQTWRIPSRQECLACHTETAGFALSFNTPQLNRIDQIDSVEQNVLSYFSDLGILDTPITAPETLPRYFASNDESATLEQRARSYSSVNCVSCHQPNGGTPASWDARHQLDLSETGLINGVAANNGGDDSKRLIIRGAPERSIILDRVAARNGFGRMPPIGSNVLDESGIALLDSWIGVTNPENYFFADWRLFHFGSLDSTDGDPQADPDNDNNSNRLEFLNLTLPLDRDSNWQPSFTRNDNIITIQFPAAPDRVFTIETSDDLSTWNDWQVDDNPPATDPETTIDATIQGPLNPEVDETYFRITVDEDGQ